MARRRSTPRRDLQGAPARATSGGRAGAEAMAIAGASRPAPAWVEFAVRHGFWITLAAAVVAQLAHWLSVRANDPFYAQTFRGFDMYTYWTWGQKITGGDWLSKEFTNAGPFYYGPLYPYFLSAVFWVLGESYGAVHGLQALAGVFPPLFVFWSTRRVFGPGSALASGLLAAFCAPFLFYEQLLLMEGLLILIHAAMLWMLVRGQGGGRGAWAWALGAGAMSGIACWGRGNFLLAIPLLAVAWGAIPRILEWAPRGGEVDAEGDEKAEARSAAAVRRYRAIAGGMCAAAYLAGAGAFLAIPLARNLVVAHRFVITTSNGPILLYIGNASDAEGLFSYPASYDRLVKQYGSMDKVPWKRELRRDLLANPGRFIALFAKKCWMFWNSYDIADNVSYYLNKRYSWLVRWSPVAWVTVVPLGVLGVVLRRCEWRRQLIPYVYAAGFSLSIIAVFVVGRYRVEMLLAFLVWAGAGVAGWGSLVWNRRYQAAAMHAVAVAAGVAILWPTLSPAARLNTPSALPAEWRRSVQLIRPNDYNSAAVAHLKLKRSDRARELLEEGVRAHPWYDPLVSRLGALYVEEGAPESAVRLLQNYINAFGRASPAIHVQLAVALAHGGHTAEARAQLEAVLRADPSNAEARALLDSLSTFR